MNKNTYTKKELFAIVDLLLQNPDAVIDYLENENSSYDVESLTESTLKLIDDKYKQLTSEAIEKGYNAPNIKLKPLAILNSDIDYNQVFHSATQMLSNTLNYNMFKYDIVTESLYIDAYVSEDKTPTIQAYNNPNGYTSYTLTSFDTINTQMVVIYRDGVWAEIV